MKKNNCQSIKMYKNFKLKKKRMNINNKTYIKFKRITNSNKNLNKIKKYKVIFIQQNNKANNFQNKNKYRLNSSLVNQKLKILEVAKEEIKVNQI